MNKPIIRKYQFPSLVAYFQHQADQYQGDRRRDTHARLAQRVGCSHTTIARLAARTNDPSYKLALDIAKDIDCPPDAIGKSGVA